ncbi:hypothetical protein V8E53_009664 [Lactarius tabidus]
MALDFEFESSDILGGDLPVGRGRVVRHSGFSFLFKTCALGVCTLFFLLAFRHGRTFFLRWKERHYKLSMRRRYGIPDHDQRPFNVAYAAARLSQEDRKKQDRIRTLSNLNQPNPVGQVSTRTGEICDPPSQQTVLPVTLRVSGYDEDDKPITKRSSLTSSTPNQPPRVPIPSARSDLSSSRIRFPSRGDAYNAPHDEEQRVHRDSKLESNHAGHDSGAELDSAPVTRKSKRMADSSDDSDLRSSQENRHDKRRRKASNRRLKKHVRRGDEIEMEVDGSDVKPSRVAKKRDRTEVESTFGADDDMSHNEDVDSALSRHRKRRQRKSAHIFRGQKRGRDLDSPGVDTDYSNPRGKGRAFRRRSTTSDTDLSAEDAQMSKDPLCKGRRIGEEWEAHGVQFRVGPDGQRLRKVLIKEDRLKFNMPVDSEHPDRSASVTAIVERWYNEDEYMAAKEAHELAWQDSDKSSAEPEMPTDRVRTPSNAGKQLLWASTSNTGSPVRKIRISGHSSAIASPRITMFSIPPPPQYARRVSSLYSSSAMKPSEMSPKLRPSRSYSKWEKQEIEAEAIARLRRKAEEKEKAKADAEAKAAEATKAAEAAKAALALSLAPPPTLPKSDATPPVTQTTTPAFSVAQPPKAEARVADSANTPSFSKLPSSSSDTRPSESKDKSENKMTLAAPGPSFSFPTAPMSTSQKPAPTPSGSGPPPSNPAIPSFFAQSAPHLAAAPPPNANVSVAPPSSFSFGQTKAPANPSVANGPLTSQGDGSGATSRGTFSFPQPSNSTSTTTNGNNFAVPSTVGAGDSQKPKFNFGLSTKPPSTSLSNPPAAPAPPNPPKPSFGFGQSMSSSVPSVTNPNATASSSTLAPSGLSSSMFGVQSNGKPSAAPAVSDIKPSASAGTENRGPKEAPASSAALFGFSNGAAKAPDTGSTKSISFAPGNMSAPSAKPFFSFGAVSGTGNSKPDTGKAPTTFTFGASGVSTPSAVPPTPGSVFSDSAAKNPQNSGPIAQPLFGAAKNAATGGGFTFGQTTTAAPPSPFTFGAFGSQKS